MLIWEIVSEQLFTQGRLAVWRCNFTL